MNNSLILGSMVFQIQNHVLHKWFHSQYDLTLTLNNKSKVDVIYFDFAKAFDSVSQDLIPKKLKHEYKVDGLMLRFIKSYLQGRQQQVVIGGVASSQ